MDHGSELAGLRHALIDPPRPGQKVARSHDAGRAVGDVPHQGPGPELRRVAKSAAVMAGRTARLVSRGKHSGEAALGAGDLPAVTHRLAGGEALDVEAVSRVV